MKPLRLRLQAFGPYSDTAEIDFRDLSLGGLFLIHGQTGAGKTSILDGLCFALFGKSSGSERSPEALRCDLAKPDLATEATLEFSLGLDIYKIVRRPRQQLKKKRGDGLTTALPKGDLFKVVTPATALDEAEWSLVTSGDKKTDERITELLGMTEEQFRQVVVLPQGQFRKFLSASSDDREVLLEKLFRTSHYRRLAERLQRQSTVLEAEIQAQRRDLNVQLAMANCETFEVLEEQTKDLERRRNDVIKDRETFLERYRVSAQRRETAQLAAQITKDFATCEERQKSLELRRVDRDRAHTRLETERRARPILAFDQHVLSLDRELKELDQKIAKETAAFENAAQTFTTLTDSLSAVLKRAGEIEGCRETHRRLQTTYVQVQRLEQALKARADIVKTCSNLRDTLDHARKNRVEIGSRQKQMRSAINELQTVLKDLPPLRTEIEILKTDSERKTALRTEVRELESKCHSLAAQVKTNERRHLDESEDLKKKKIKFHLAQAAALAKTLRTEEPCPVCGNTEHPQPAFDVEGAISREDIEAAENSLRIVATTLAGQQSSLENSLSELGRQLSRVGVSSIEQLETELQKQKSTLEIKLGLLEKLQSDEATFLKLQKDLEQIENSMSRADVSVQKAENEVAQAEIRHAEIATRFEQLDSEIPIEWRDLATITREGQILRGRIESFEKEKASLEAQLSQAARVESAAQASLKFLKGDVIAKLSQRSQNLANRDHALKISGLASIEAARAGAMSDEQIQTDESVRKSFDEDSAGVRARLQDLQEKKRALPEWAFDFDAIEAEFSTLEAERVQRDRDHAELDSKLNSFVHLRNQVSAVNETIKTLSDRYATLGKLAGVAMGQPPHNLSRVNFPRYILATRLDEVLEQASRRLFLMSRGQFSLRRAQSAADKRKNAGLDLEVEDSFTGTRRSTASLSGGEGFLASLSLALGVADVVQSRLGGVRLEAVFVDEGFGTLDGEALEQAIKTLSELQAGGRLVGIISHVPELKDQIARRLFVQKSAIGSRVGWDNAVL